MPDASLTNLNRLMVIKAHPDDAEFTVAGTMAVWSRTGKEVVLVLCTDGSRGSNDPGCSPEALAAIRARETAEAAAVLGVCHVVNLGYEDGTLLPTLALRRDLTRAIRRYRPDVVICSDPTARWHGDGYLNHPDHRAAGDAALDAVFPSAGTRYIFSELLAEGLEPHDVKEVWIHGAATPNHWVDISETLDLKIQALKKHDSQVGDFEDLDQWIRGWATENGVAPGLPAAEAFKRMVLVSE